jgi:flagellar basal-body rod protein FlgF
MLNGVYSLASAMDVATRQHEVIANNLANVNVPGFRRTLLAVSTDGTTERGNYGIVDSELHGSKAVRTFVDQSQGPLIRTGRKLDVAINGDGFFAIETPEGLRYTRNGAFQLDSTGQLVTSDGSPVMGEGPIVFNPEIDLSKVTIDEDGTIRASGTEIGKLQVSSFDNLDDLIQTGPTQFEAPDTLTPTPFGGVVMQETLESGNASIVNEMVAMIMGMRHFEAAQQGMRSISDVIQQYTTFQD